MDEAAPRARQPGVEDEHEQDRDTPQALEVGPEGVGGRPLVVLHGTAPHCLVGPSAATGRRLHGTPGTHERRARGRARGAPLDFGAGAGLLDPVDPPQAFVAASARAFSQSLRNWTMPVSVSGWWTIWRRTLKGVVAMCAPASAASVM